MRQVALYILVLFLFPTITLAQKIGQWNSHFSYEQDITQIIASENEVYALTDGKLFGYIPSDESLTTYATVNGANISKAAYSKKHGCLVVVRTNSDIDLIYTQSRITNIPGLKNLAQNIDKTVNSISIDGDLAYLSTNFGLLIVNLEKGEIKESAIFHYPFNSTCVYNSKLYASTDKGTKVIDLSLNLQYPENWNNISLSDKYSYSDYTFNDSEITQFEVFDNKLTFLIPSKAVYYYNGSVVERILQGQDPQQMLSANNRLFVYQPNRIWEIKDATSFNQINTNGKNLNALFSDNSKTNLLWVSFKDQQLSLIKTDITTNSYEEVNTQIRPDGPLTNFPFFMAYSNDRLLLTGGRSSTNRHNIPAQLSQLKDGSWFNFSKSEIDAATGGNSRDFVSAISDPNDPDHILAASWGEGMYEFRNKKFIKRYDYDNSTLESVSTKTPPTAGYTRVNGMSYDKSGNLWTQCSYAINRIKIFKKDGTWAQIYQKDAERQNTSAKTLIIDRYNYKWLSTYGGIPFILVYDDRGTIDNTSDDRYKFTNSFVDQDGKSIQIFRINCMVEDNSSNIWVGTDAGVFVIYNSTQIFSKDLVLNKIKIPNDDGTADILLENVEINALMVDGANRKWIATGTGVYVVNDTGQETINHFTMENSLLPDNSIISLAYDPKTGIAYVGSEKGMASYKTEATEAAKSFSNVYAYPNPVRPEYEGPIVISGLMENSSIKITDVKGNLIHQGKSVGGQYTWDGRNAKKTKVETGVYIVFGASEDGKEGVVTKIMFVNN